MQQLFLLTSSKLAILEKAIDIVKPNEVICINKEAGAEL